MHEENPYYSFPSVCWLESMRCQTSRLKSLSPVVIGGASGLPVSLWGPEYSSRTPLFVLVILCLWASVLGKDFLKQRSTGGQCVEVESRASGSGRPTSSPSAATDWPCELRQVTLSLQPQVSSLVDGV